MAVKMRVSKDRKVDCNCCGNNAEDSVEMFDMLLKSKKEQTIIHVCDRCITDIFDKTLKARCLVDGMVKSPKQIRIINNRKRLESKKKYS